MRYRYENHNRFPVLVPAKKGGTITFASGQGTNDEWYSRFVGERQLSRIPIAGIQPPAPVAPSPSASVAVLPQALPVLEKIVGLVTETTDHWTKKNGIYYCKHCDMFRTGSRQAMVNHLDAYHQLDVEAALKSAPPPKPESKPEPKSEPKPEPESEPEPEPGPEAPEEKKDEAPKPEEKAPEEPVLNCPHCERKYKTERGLRKHIATVHGGPDAVADAEGSNE